MLHNFTLVGRQTRLWQNTGETYGHVLMKALAYAMFVDEYPTLEIERRVGLRYKPDLISIGQNGGFDLWCECGENSIRKTAWILKHANAKRLVLFKIGGLYEPLVRQLREEIPIKYRSQERLKLVSFIPEVHDLTANRQIARVSDDWFTSIII